MQWVLTQLNLMCAAHSMAPWQSITMQHLLMVD
jgi:hypothetical protein